MELLISGWLLLSSVGDEGILAVDTKRNLYLTIDRRHVSRELASYPENSWARLSVWATCREEQDGLARARYCSSARPVKLRPCGPREGMWVNGVQYC